MKITAQIRGDRVIQSTRNIGKRAPDVLKRDIKSAMENAKKEASGEWKPKAQYNTPLTPLQLIGKGYKRTGVYGKSFAVKPSGRMSYALTSDARDERGRPYTKIVGGDAYGKGQAEIHVDRWSVISVVVNKWLKTLLAEIKSDLSAIVRGEGMGT